MIGYPGCPRAYREKRWPSGELEHSVDVLSGDLDVRLDIGLTHHEVPTPNATSLGEPEVADTRSSAAVADSTPPDQI